MKKRIQRKFVFILSALFIFFFYINRPVFSERAYSLEAVLRMSLKNAEILASRSENIRSKAFMKKQAEAWQNPSFSVDIGRKQTANASGNTVGFSASQPFYFYGKRGLRREIASLDEALAKLSYTEIKLYVYYRTLVLAYEYFLADIKRLHAEERVRRFQLLRAFLRGRPLISPRQRISRYIVENRIRLLTADLLQIKAEKDIAWRKLNVFLNLKKPINVTLMPVRKAPNMELANLLRSGNERNIEVLRILANIRKKKSQRDLAAREIYPDVDLGIYYSRETALDTEKYYGGQITFRLPLLNRNEGLVKSKEAEIRSERHRLAFAKRRMAEDIHRTYIEYVLAGKILQKLPFSLIRTMHRQMVTADQAFRKGLVDFPTYLEMESQVWESHLAVYRTQLSIVATASRLFQLAGKIAPIFQKK